MLQYGACPVCKTDINKDRLQQGVLICQACGWSDKRSDNAADEKAQNRFVLFAIGLSVILMAGFIHTVTWDTYSIEIIGLKGKQLTGMANEGDLNRIADICFQRKSPSCMITALSQATKGQSVSNETWARLGKVLWQTKRPEKAAIAYASYFQQGGDSTDVAFNFARALSETGNYVDSDKYFRFVLDSKPKMLQITVTQAYVDMLVKSKQLAVAENIIESFRKKGDNAALFMDRELREIQKLQASM